MTKITRFEVRKNALAETRCVETPIPALVDGQVLVKIDRFAFTANNVTYGVVGERIGYWKFFPTGTPDWGVIPVWGFADVVQSRSAEIPVGERLYGYWPMATHVVISPTRVKDGRLFDGAAHRAELPPVYNAYARVGGEPEHDPSMDDERMVLYPLYATSYCLYDFALDNDWFGAKQTIIVSASSKTAIGTAYAMKSDPGAPRLVGLTSARNRDAVRALDLYDDVVVYDDIADRIDAAVPTLIIDMSGNGAVIGTLHRHLQDNMRFTSNVGITHYEDAGMKADYIKDRSAMFFAPGHIQKRAADWGPGVFEAKAFGFWKDAAIRSRSWLSIRRETGADAVARAYADVYNGRTPADSAWVVSF